MHIDSPKPLVIHAPSIHMGGGLVLLRTMLASAPEGIRRLLLDARSRDRIQPPADVSVDYVRRSALSRLGAEWRLRRDSRDDEVVLCFHGLPPLFRLRGQVVVFLQNRLLVNRQPLSGYPLSTRLRLVLERRFLRAFRGHADRFVVQTPSMARDLRQALGDGFDLSVTAFAAAIDSAAQPLPERYDFVYVANDDPHKNHRHLLAAWRLLAADGLTPSLALTLPPGSVLAATVERLRQEGTTQITDLGTLSHDEVTRLYASSSALVFPSVTESFGLPLIEASNLGLPVLAPELDYVRDVIEPVQTFDPHSPLSLARAVKRFLGQADATFELQSARDFLAEVRR